MLMKSVASNSPLSQWECFQPSGPFMNVRSRSPDKPPIQCKNALVRTFLSRCGNFWRQVCLVFSLSLFLPKFWTQALISKIAQTKLPGKHSETSLKQGHYVRIIAICCLHFRESSCRGNVFPDFSPGLSASFRAVHARDSDRT